MRALEARYHPLDRESSSFVVVAHILWDADADPKRGPRIEPSAELAKQVAPATMLATLRHLVLMTAPDPFGRLPSLRNRFWSFVQVDAQGAEAPAE